MLITIRNFFAIQEGSTDKASVGSGRSFRDDVDATSMSSIHKRMTFAQRMPKLNASQHRTVSIDSTNNIPELTNQELQQDVDSVDLSSANNGSTSQVRQRSPNTTNYNDNVPSMHATAIAGDSVSQTSSGASEKANAADSRTTTAQKSPVVPSGAATASNVVAVPATTSKSLNSKNMSKAAILRNLFFSQNHQQHAPSDGASNSTSNGGGGGSSSSKS